MSFTSWPRNLRFRRANRTPCLVSAVAAALAAITLTAPATAYVTVYGGPAFINDYGAVIGVNDVGTAVGNVYTEESALENSWLAVRWDGSGAPAVELGLGSVFGINEAGTSVGFAIQYVSIDPSEVAVRWDASATTATELGNLGTSNGNSFASAMSINNAGAAIGWAEKYSGTGLYQGVRAVRWNAAGAPTELDTLNAGFGYAVINDVGTAVGWLYSGTGDAYRQRAVRWDAAGTSATELGSLGVDAIGLARNGAFDINNSGTTVGWAEKYDDMGVLLGQRAVRWDAAGTSAIELDNLGVDENSFPETSAYDINDAGIAVGFSDLYDDLGEYLGSRAVRWDAAGTAVTELGNLGTDDDDYTWTYVSAINDAGIAVGYADDYDDAGANLGERAVYWGLDDEAVDLNTLIDPASGWTLSQAHAISNTGWIGGSGDFDPDGTGGQDAYARLFLLQIPATSDLPGDYNQNGTVDAADFSVWRDSLGSATLTNRGPGIPGPVGMADYEFWKSHFGEPFGTGGASHLAPGESPGATYAAPEPTTVLLTVIGLSYTLVTTRRHTSTRIQISEN